MMTHPAGAAHRAGPAASGSTNEAGRGLGVEFDGPATPASAGAEAAPFSQALQALAAGTDAHASDAAAIDPADTDVEADADESPATNSAAGTQEVGASKGGVMPAGTWRFSSALAGSPTDATATNATEPATVNTADPTASKCTSPGAGAGALVGADARTGVGATGDAGSSQRGPRAPSARQSASRREAHGVARNVARAVAAPKPGAAALPNDLLQALFAAQCALPAQSGTAPGAVAAAVDEHHENSEHGDAMCDADDGAAAALMPVPVTMPMQPQSAAAGAAMPAAVLQRMQPPHSDSNERNAASTGPGAVEPRAVDAPAAAAGGMSAALAAADAPAKPSPIHGVVASVSVPPGKPVAARDADSPRATSDAPPLPRSAADVAVGALSMAAALRAASANNPSPTELTVAVPVHDRHWPAAVATQVLILGNGKVQAATLRLSPEHLGPVEVRIDMQDANVNVNFTAVHADTRAALEQALPELRTVLAGAGLTLGQATVQQQTRHESQIPNAPPRNGVAAAETTIEAPATTLRTLGIVDEYA